MLKVPYRILVIVLCSMIAAISCSKKNNDVTPSPVDSVYLPTAIYNGGAPMDSFVYNDNNTVAKMFYGANRFEYGVRAEFDYNEAGQCKRLRYYNAYTGELQRVDSLVYGTNGDVVAACRFPDGTSDNYNLKLKLNSNGALIGFVQDTVDNGTTRYGLILDITMNNGNLTKCINHYYSIEDGYPTFNSDFTYTFSYDNHANSLLEFFRKNPYIQVSLFYQRELILFTASANTVSGCTTTHGSDSEVLSIINTYDSATNLLTNQEVQQGNAIWNSFSFQYKKTTKK